MPTETEQEVHVPTEQEVAQHVHADIMGISDAALKKAQKEEKDHGGGSICICRHRGCRIGPMMHE